LAGLQDRDGAALVLDKIRNSFHWLELIWAEYNAHQVDTAVGKVPSFRIEIVKRNHPPRGIEWRLATYVVGLVLDSMLLV
jgi:hypothetical protein